MTRKTGPDKATVEAVKRRSGGMCERCGVKPSEQVHHRRARGMGGTRNTEVNETSSLVDICAACHLFIETNRAYGYESGWLISKLSSVKAWQVPLERWNGCVLLDNYGGWVLNEDRLS